MLFYTVVLVLLSLLYVYIGGYTYIIATVFNLYRLMNLLLLLMSYMFFIVYRTLAIIFIWMMPFYSNYFLYFALKPYFLSLINIFRTEFAKLFFFFWVQRDGNTFVPT